MKTNQYLEEDSLVLILYSSFQRKLFDDEADALFEFINR